MDIKNLTDNLSGLFEDHPIEIFALYCAYKDEDQKSILCALSDSILESDKRFQTMETIRQEVFKEIPNYLLSLQITESVKQGKDISSLIGQAISTKLITPQQIADILNPPKEKQEIHKPDQNELGEEGRYSIIDKRNFKLEPFGTSMARVDGYPYHKNQKPILVDCRNESGKMVYDKECLIREIIRNQKNNGITTKGKLSEYTKKNFSGDFQYIIHDSLMYSNKWVSGKILSKFIRLHYILCPW